MWTGHKSRTFNVFNIHKIKNETYVYLDTPFWIGSNNDMVYMRVSGTQLSSVIL